MKKLIFALAAVVALAACSKEQTIVADRGDAIGFGTPFVENSTRADYSSTLINAFKVYGTVTGNNNTVTIYNGADVTRGTAAYGQAWTCGQTEYWIPSATYAFQAVVDGEIANGTIAYTVGQDKGGDGISDLLYAAASASTDANATPTGDLQNGNVAFNFQHLLSKVGFTFTNGVTANAAYTFNVTGVSFTGHDTTGTYTISTGKWDEAVTKSAEALSFGVPGVVASEAVAAPTTHQIIPGKQTLKVTVNYDILYKGQTVYKGMSVTKDMQEHTFEQSKVYNITVTLPAPGAEIKFTVQSAGTWTEGTGAELTY